MIIIIRTVILYTTVVTALRLMGKKQIGQLEPSELAIAIMISEIASIPLASNDTPLLNGIIPILVLAAIEILLSFFVMKSVTVRKIITGHPTVIIKDGVIMEKSLGNLRYTIDDLLVEMRAKGIADLSQVSYAILETNGQVSFIQKKADASLTPRQMNITAKDESPAFPVITERNINYEYLDLIGKDEEWLFSQLKKKNLSIDKIFILTADNESIKFIQEESGENISNQ